MKTKMDQTGALNVLLIPLILAVIFLISAIGFGAWAFIDRQDYKNNSDEKAEAAVAVATEKTKTSKDNEFLQREKEPLKAYSAPLEYGGFNLKYPKTWSAYANEQTEQLTLTMQPDVVSSNPKTAYALKVEILNTAYNQSVNTFNAGIKQGKVTATSYILPKVPSVVGLRVDGEVATGKNGSIVFLPLRGKTIKITTETETHLADFNDIILPNFEFQP